MSETLMGVGAQMMRYARAEHQDLPRALTLNGATLHMSVGSTSDSVDTVLDRYESMCAGRDGGMTQHWRNWIRRFGPLPWTRRAQQTGRSSHPSSNSASNMFRVLQLNTLRADTDAQGFVACLDMGATSLPLREWTRRIERFTRSTDVADIGSLRYVFAERSGSATRLVTIWSDDSLALRTMFPPTGDAPGEDLRDMPRPAGARRVLFSREEGHPQTLVMYRTARESGAQPNAMRAYAARLRRNGWNVLPHKNESERGGDSFVVEKPHRMVAVLRSPRADTLTLVTLHDSSPSTSPR
jgi:hypothetical protein